jgi:glycolate oxidase
LQNVKERRPFFIPILQSRNPAILQCWALAAAGEDGIVRMLELLEDEVIRCLGLLGVTSFKELDKSYLHQATATNPPGVFSAFPLLDIEPYRY